MADHAGVDWKTCNLDGCIGIQLPDGGKCWAHADEQHLEAALEQVSKRGRLDARGVLISEELLKLLIAAATSSRQGYVLEDARFDQATFLGDADFSIKKFTGAATFVGATFKRKANFNFTIFTPVNRYSSNDDAAFANTTFEGSVSFRDARFERIANFERAEFKKAAWFWNVFFWSRAKFSHASFRDDAFFYQTSFRDDALFFGTAFDGGAYFWTLTDLLNVHRDDRNYSATFRGDAHFSGATFNYAEFRYVTFKRDATFSGATFADAEFRGARFHDALFTGVTFQRYAGFEGATFHGDAWFRAAKFEQSRELGPLRARKALVLDHAVFQQAVTISASAAACCCHHTQFIDGAQLRLRWAEVILDDADLSGPSLLAGVPSFPGVDEARWARALARLNQMHGNGDRDSRPRLLSLHRANVAGLTAANVDLRACRFAGAHHLDQLRFEECIFAAAPRNWRTARLTIAEEHQWRARRRPSRAVPRNPDDPKPATSVPIPAEARNHTEWYSPLNRPPAWADDDPVTPRQIAGLYRALRKGREDSKDEPGAADFYYGEMEMRRHDRTALKAERLVLFLYWLTSGYALRASRSLAWLLASLVAATLVLAEWGLSESGMAANWSFPARLGTAALVAIEGAVFRASEQQLTYTGQLIQDFLRFAGPIFLGLALLSIRGRVKR